MTAADWIGLVGVSILLFAFVLNLFKKTTPDSFLYLCLNAIGASLACLASVLIEYLPFVVLEGVWAGFSWVRLVGLLVKRTH